MKVLKPKASKGDEQFDFRGPRSTHNQMNVALICLKRSFSCVVDRNLWIAFDLSLDVSYSDVLTSGTMWLLWLSGI